MVRLLLIWTGIFLSSCDDKGQHFDHSDVIGSYRITEWNAPVPVDLDQDGISSRNLLDESNCFHTTEIILFADREFVKTYRSMVGESMTCQTENWNGTWKRTSDRLTLTWETSDGVISDNYNFGSVNERLTRTIENSSYPNINDDGELISEIGHVNIIFTKISD